VLAILYSTKPSSSSKVAPEEIVGFTAIGDCSACAEILGITELTHHVSCILEENATNTSLVQGVCLCLPGYALINTSLSYQGHSNPCVDVNECLNTSLVTATCGAGVGCVNFNGSFGCGCSSGYILNYSLVPVVGASPIYDYSCTDINECSSVQLNNLGGPCNGTNSACVNTQGSFLCDCRCGFQYVNGSTAAYDPVGPFCEDINECAVGNPSELCPQTPGTDCLNAPGTYCCTANQGYTTAFSTNVSLDMFSPACPSGVFTKCSAIWTDVDECATGDATCPFLNPPENCVNTPGSYVCTPSG
jgi:hypothetical protein